MTPMAPREYRDGSGRCGRSGWDTGGLMTRVNTPAGTTAVVWLDGETGNGAGSELGGKAGSLARLMRAGLGASVPPGFVVPADGELRSEERRVGKEGQVRKSQQQVE